MIDADLAVRAALTHLGSVFVEHPADIVDRLPCLVFDDLGGPVLSVGRCETHELVVEAWALTRSSARALADSASVALLDAWTGRTLLPTAYINGVVVTGAPVFIPPGVDGVWRTRATYQIELRKP